VILLQEGTMMLLHVLTVHYRRYTRQWKTDPVSNMNIPQHRVITYTLSKCYVLNMYKFHGVLWRSIWPNG